MAMRVYFDNDVVSRISRRDGAKTEMDAIDRLMETNRASQVEIGTSRQSPREMERAPLHHQATLKTGLSELEVSADDSRLLGFCQLTDRYGGFISYPMLTEIVDGRLYADLLAYGLKADDAKHLMYAVHQGYERFLTCDGGILSRRSLIEQRCPPLRVQRPSDLAAELLSVSVERVD